MGDRPSINRRIFKGGENEEQAIATKHFLVSSVFKTRALFSAPSPL